MKNPGGWVCHSEALPGYVWVSSSDATGFLPGWECRRIEGELPNSGGPTSWATMWKLARLIQGLGW